MTYSIIARCLRTGQFGLGVASYSQVIGMHCDAAVRPNVGVTFTQGSLNPRNNCLDLRVDLCTAAVGELRRIYADYKPTAAYYDERARNPHDAISAREFAANLAHRRTQGTE